MRAVDVFTLRQQLDARQLAVLQDLRRYRLLSASQIQRLHFGDTAIHKTKMAAARASNRGMHYLRDLRLVAALERRVGGKQQGSAPTIWQLTDRGARVLSLGNAPLKRTRFAEPSSSLFVQHTLAIAEAAVQVKELGARSKLELLTLQAEPECWRTFLGENGVPESLRPDLYVVLANDSFEQHAFIEVDLATEHAPQIQRKLRLYSRYAASGSAERDSGVVPRVIWVVPNDVRARWLERIIASDRQLMPDQFEVITEKLPAAIATGLLQEPFR